MVSPTASRTRRAAATENFMAAAEQSQPEDNRGVNHRVWSVFYECLDIKRAEQAGTNLSLRRVPTGVFSGGVADLL